MRRALHLLFLLAAYGTAHAQVNSIAAGQRSVASNLASIITKSYDAARTSSTQDAILTPSALRGGLVQLPPIPVRGSSRGMESEPLVDAAIPGVGPVMVLPSMGNIVRGVDPNTGAGLWETATLCTPVNSTPQNDMWRVNDKFGAISTGLVLTRFHRYYGVLTCSEDGSGSQQSMQQRMFVLDLRTGTVLSNTLIDATSNGLRYADSPRKQRAGLALWSQNGVDLIVIAAGSFAETGANATGWVLVYDTYDNRVKMALSTRAGIWMSAQAPSIDSKGFIYLGAGNGPYNGVTTFGEAIMKIQLTPPSAAGPGALTVVGSWAMFSDSSRTCANPQLTQPPQQLVDKVAGVDAPSGVPGASMPMVNGSKCGAAWGDQDANLTGTLLLDRYYLSAGKDGIGVVIDTQNFPRTAPADFANSKANCAKVKGIYQFGWNLGTDSCPADMSQLNQFYLGKTRHIHAPPVQVTGPDLKTYVLFCAENSPVQAWRINPDGTMKYIARGQEVASAQSTGIGGMPGCFGSAVKSAEGTVALFSVPDRDANRGISTGHMTGYDVSDLGALEGTGKFIPTIWTSGTYTFNKFMAPVVWNGQIFYPDYDGKVLHYGLPGAAQ